MQNILLYNKVSLAFLVAAMAYGALMEDYASAAATLLVSVSLACLVKAFQDKQGVRHTYLCGVVLALAAAFWPYMLALFPLFAFFLLKPLEALSWRNVMAMLLGVLTPAWMYLPFGLAAHVRAMDWEMADRLWKVPPVSFLEYQDIDVAHAIAYGLLLLLLLLLTVHRSSYRFKGKLFVRTQRSIYICMVWGMAVLTVLLPSFAGYLLPMMAAFVGPVAAQRVGER